MAFLYAVLRQTNAAFAFGWRSVSNLRYEKMDFNRKLSKRNSIFATITIPQAVLAAWIDVNNVAMHFDKEHNVLTVKPVDGDL